MANNQEIKENTRKRKVIEAGKALFTRFGFRKVTIEEICKEAAISKMTYYRFFANKTELVRFILTELSEEGLRSYREIMNQDIPFEEKIRQTIRMKELSAAQFSQELLRDIYEDREGDLTSLIQKLTAETMTLILEDYRIAQEKGHIRKNINLSFIPFILNQMSNLVSNPALLAIYQGNMKDAMKELTNLFFYGIMEPDRRQPNEN